MIVDIVGDSQKRQKQANPKSKNIPMIIDKEGDSQKCK